MVASYSTFYNSNPPQSREDATMSDIVEDEYTEREPLEPFRVEQIPYELKTRNPRCFVNSCGLLLCVLAVLLPSLVLMKGSDEGTTPGADGHEVDGQIEDETAALKGHVTHFGPFSTLDPVDDLGLYGFTRSAETSPSRRLDPLRRLQPNLPLPTSAWYENLLLLPDGQTPGVDHRAYTLPYIVDAAGDIPGLRVHSSSVETSSRQVIVTGREERSLTLGATTDFRKQLPSPTDEDKGYSVTSATDLGVTLNWEYLNMSSTIAMGMPYATMVYDSFSGASDILPTVSSPTGLMDLRVDGEETVECSKNGSFRVERDIVFETQIGLTWVIFFSDSVTVQCVESDQGDPWLIQVVQADGVIEGPLLLRLALVVPNMDVEGDAVRMKEEYITLLREHSVVYPGENTSVSYSMNYTNARLTFDWDAKLMDQSRRQEAEMLMYALPHHQDKLNPLYQFCTEALLGKVCLVKGSTWHMMEDLPEVSFRAPRSPDPEYLPALVDALGSDLNYTIPQNYMIGAGDSYFSGKMLAKLARIVVVAQEVFDLCSVGPRASALEVDDWKEVCSKTTLPSRGAFDGALGQLRRGVEIWLNGLGQSPLVYDSAWRGMVSCGCIYQDGQCANTLPNCPAFSDQGLNFGNGFYNDHHFHYGYHIYAAAVLSNFDREWGLDNFEDVLLLVRDIANPSVDDNFFPTVRHKDWYHGSSWASGIVQPPCPMGMNQESSSEAIAAYEAVALYGQTMRTVFEEFNDEEKMAVSDEIHRVGLLLTATELRSAQRYWHVSPKGASQRIYKPEYDGGVVGILWSSKLFYGTWFGNKPYMVYGIQLLPLTSISESRDPIEWVEEAFHPLAESCDKECVSDGWSIQVLAILATIGHKEKASNSAVKLSSEVFEGAGGNGHSKSNTLWYIATRPSVEEPYTLTESYPWEEVTHAFCSTSSTCTEQVLNTMAGEYTCKERIQWLVESQGISEWEACSTVAVSDYPEECGQCNPLLSAANPDSEDHKGTDGNDGTTDKPGADDNPETGLSCLQPTTCTKVVLETMAGDYSCGSRIQWLIDVQGMSQQDACKVVAVTEFPSECGPCNPEGAT